MAQLVADASACPDLVAATNGSNIQTFKPYEHGAEFSVLFFSTLCYIVILIVLYVTVNDKNMKQVLFLARYSKWTCIGALLLISTVLAWPLEDTDATCKIKPWLLAPGFGVMFGSVFVKARFIYKEYIRKPKYDLKTLMVLRRKRKEEEEVPPLGCSKEYAMYIFNVLSKSKILWGILAIELTLVVNMFAPECLRPHVLYLCYQEPGNPILEVHTTCFFEESLGAIIVAVNLVPILSWVVTVRKVHTELKSEGFKLRNVDVSHVDEFKHVQLSILVVFVVAIVVVIIAVTPLQTATVGGRVAWYVIRSYASLFVVMFPLFVLHRTLVKTYTLDFLRRVRDGTQGGQVPSEPGQEEINMPELASDSQEQGMQTSPVHQDQSDGGFASFNVAGDEPSLLQNQESSTGSIQEIHVTDVSVV